MNKPADAGCDYGIANRSRTVVNRAATGLLATLMVVLLGYAVHVAGTAQDRADHASALVASEVAQLRRERQGDREVIARQDERLKAMQASLERIERLLEGR